MTIEFFIDKFHYKEFNEIKNKKLFDIISYIKENNIERLYITNNLYPIFLFDYEVVLDLVMKRKIDITFNEYYESIKKDYQLIVLNSQRHIVDCYNYLRKLRLNYAPIVKDNKIIGEVNFDTLSLKISYIAIKDKLTNAFNEKYFNVLIDEYNYINKEIGVIIIKLFDLEIYESLYGYDFKLKILKRTAETIKNSIRNIDFLFRNNNYFKILTFNNAEITLKIKNRIDNRLFNLEIDNIQIPYKILATQIPEMDSNLLLGLERLEKELIKRN